MRTKLKKKITFHLVQIEPVPRNAGKEGDGKCCNETLQPGNS